MAFEHVRIHPDRPAARFIQQAAKHLQQGGFVVLPTETTYAIIMLCQATDAQQQVCQLRRLDNKHLWSLMCEDLSQAAQFVKIDNVNHRIVKHHLPGPYTFILPANSKVPRRVLSKRKEIGIRIPGTTICHSLQQALGEPLLATTMQFPDEDYPACDPEQMALRLRHVERAMLLDGGWGGMEPSTIVNLCDGQQELVRQGAGEWPQ